VGGEAFTMQVRINGAIARTARSAALAVSMCVAGFPAVPSAQPANQVDADCRQDGSLTELPGLPEASGLAMSRRIADRLWAHNDSAEPVLFGLDTKGAVRGRLRVSGAQVEDWEAVAVGPCPSGSCVYIGDIGDNDARRNRITVYRIAEPSTADGTAKVTDAYHATYPDGPQDAEALLIATDGRIHIVTKGETRDVALYRFPADAQAGTAVKLERVGKARPGARGENDRITDGAISPDGSWVALRSKRAVMFYRASDLLAGNWREHRRVSLAALGEPQGEGIAFGPGGTIYLAGEGGGKSRPGTFARLACSLGA
jgi:hypothetical protein